MGLALRSTPLLGAAMAGASGCAMSAHRQSTRNGPAAVRRGRCRSGSWAGMGRSSLLPSMVVSGRSFGASFDALADGIVLVPDLLGSGNSRQVTEPPGATAHLDALDQMLAELGLRDRPLFVEATPWAVRSRCGERSAIRATVPARGGDFRGARLYRTLAGAAERLARMDGSKPSLAGGRSEPPAVCAWMCRHPAAAAWLLVTLRPDLPPAMASLVEPAARPAARAGSPGEVGRRSAGRLDGVVDGFGRRCVRRG